MKFEFGRLYNRRRDIHDEYGGQRQGGISTPAEHPYLFLFTGESGEQFGYADGWTEEGVFVYTGEGQRGDMSFTRGNRSIRDHAENGKDILLFQSLGKRKPVQFLGRFNCSTWEYKQAPDVDGKMRQVIVFHLIGENAEAETSGSPQPIPSSNISLDELRQLAMAAGSGVGQSTVSKSLQTYRHRSKLVRSYVLERAGANCESCRKPAPFTRSDSTPYLEPHHIRRLSDDGPDDPRWVAGICPNCHREIHYGAEGSKRNDALEAYVQQLEARQDD